MRLKRIRLFGFKTFAERTEISLDGDIVAIVGPNGCGKSNIVDGLVWGLGESNMRSVRAQTGKEVVFAGSSHRKPLGYAEVSVTFDNEDGLLPIDAAEATVTRRVTREGDNTYQINRRNCRLRDVAELLADTGLSRTGYAIVSQSEIDQALAASSYQRRQWIDEAAGVQRYRLRRVEAMRRLAAANEHLSRVDDVIRELENQRGPLEREAKEALEYRELTGRLKGIETGLLACELVDAGEALLEAQARIDALRNTIAAEAALAEQHSEAARAAQAEATSLEAAQLRALGDESAATRQADLARTALEVARARLASLSDLESALEEEGQAGQERLEHAQSDLASARAQAEKDVAALAELNRLSEGTDARAQSLTAALEQAEARLAEAKAQDDRRRAYEIEAAHRERRSQDLERELIGALKAMDELRDALVAAERELAEATEAYDAAKAGLEGIVAVASEVGRAVEEASARRRELLSRSAMLEGKRAGLQASLDAHDGLSAGSRAVLEAAKRGEIAGEFLPVGEALDVEPAHAAAIDAALGAAANDLIVANEALAKQAIAFLRDQRAGRATFQPLTLVRKREATTAARLANRPGVVGVASEIAHTEDRYRPVIESLLGRVLVVEDLDAAFRLVGTPGWSKAVTLDGDVVFAGGAVTGGKSARHGAGMVERAAELAAAETELAALAKELATLDATLEKLALDEEARQSARKEADESLAPLAKARDEALAFRHAVFAEHNETERACARLKAEREELAKPVEVPQEADLEAAESAREAALRDWAEFSAQSASQLSERDAAVARAKASADRVAELEKRLAAIAEAIESGKARRVNVGPETESLQLQIAEAAAEHEKWQAEVRKAADEAAKLATAKAEAQERAREAERAASAARTAGSAAEAESHKLEIALTRHDLKRASAAARLLEEYGIEEAAARAIAEQGRPEPDAASLVASLRRQIKAMGDVNVGAIEAYERLSVRYEELSVQRADVVGGKEQIEASIRELDKLTSERFAATFEEVRKQFKETFVKVFEGGEAEISLVEADDPLDAGVDIQVTLPGKRRQRLELLSGGERALGALTFLCSLLKVRPSPLVVLDEVDAPLDGRNVERFVALLRSFEGRSQFVVVTHNQVTIENSDVWLGVSMQEPGVSTVIPFRAPQEASSDRVLAGGYMKG